MMTTAMLRNLFRLVLNISIIRVPLDLPAHIIMVRRPADLLFLLARHRVPPARLLDIRSRPWSLNQPSCPSRM